jgi:hypothetical protein
MRKFYVLKITRIIVQENVEIISGIFQVGNADKNSCKTLFLYILNYCWSFV